MQHDPTVLQAAIDVIQDFGNLHRRAERIAILDAVRAADDNLMIGPKRERLIAVLEAHLGAGVARRVAESLLTAFHVTPRLEAPF